MIVAFAMRSTATPLDLLRQPDNSLTIVNVHLSIVRGSVTLKLRAREGVRDNAASGRLGDGGSPAGLLLLTGRRFTLGLRRLMRVNGGTAYY